MATSPKTITLVLSKRHKVAYPKTDKDFDALSALGTSIKFCTPDFLPLVQTYAATKGYSVTIELFEILELKSLANLEKRWPGPVEIVSGTLVLSCPKDKKHLDMMKSVRLSLAKFYSSHGMLVRYSIKRGTKTVKVTFTTELDPKVFVTNDER